MKRQKRRKSSLSSGSQDLESTSNRKDLWLFRKDIQSRKSMDAAQLKQQEECLNVEQ